jgi:hypothetical protein
MDWPIYYMVMANKLSPGGNFPEKKRLRKEPIGCHQCFPLQMRLQSQVCPSSGIPVTLVWWPRLETHLLRTRNRPRTYHHQTSSNTRTFQYFATNQPSVVPNDSRSFLFTTRMASLPPPIFRQRLAGFDQRIFETLLRPDHNSRDPAPFTSETA